MQFGLILVQLLKFEDFIYHNFWGELREVCECWNSSPSKNELIYIGIHKMIRLCK